MPRSGSGHERRLALQRDNSVRKISCLSSLALFSAVLFASVAVRAQGAGSEPAAQQPLTPPKLLHSVPAEAPEKLDHDVTVVLELVIDENGRIASAAVAESGGEAFDAAALQAVKGFELSPARQGTTPVSVKIRYAYVFPASAPVVESAPPPAEAKTPGTASAAAPSAAPPPAAKAAEPAASSKSEGSQTDAEEFEATASVEAPPRETTKRSVSQETIQKLPGTRGDALRSIEILPGVARTSPSQGTPILRGASWNESQTFLNGTPVPFMYHFGGLTSFMSTRLVERVDLYPGNFSARYGRVAGGVVEVKSRDPESKTLRAAIDLNLIDSSAYMETPLGERAGLALAVRRSNIDFFFKNFVPKSAYSVVAAPVYYDYQLLGFYRLDASTKLRLSAYGGDDSLELLFSHPPDEDPAITGSVNADIGFHRLGLELESRPSRGISSNVSATIGRVQQKFHIGELDQSFSGTELYSRAEASAELHPTLRLTAGADLFAWFVGGSYRGPAPGQAEGDPTQNNPLSSQKLISARDDSIDVVRPAAYVELGFRPVESLLLMPGARVDYLADTKQGSVDPRFAARYEVSPSLALKLGVGSFSQTPEWWQTIPSVGNSHLKPYRALQTSAGIEKKLGEHGKISLEGFYKHLSGVVVSTADGAAPRLENDGGGRIYGGELAAEAHWAKGGAAYLAYTLSRSERNEHGGAYRLFDNDQTHILSLVGNQGLGKGWEIGARLRLVSGNPTTPIVGSTYDARSGVYVPEYGALASQRNPTFQQLDLRIEKEFSAGPLKLAIYLDVQNVYNAKNYEGRRYSFDYQKSEAVSGLPLLPNLGLRGEL
jgi:TonB family protein